MTETTAPLWINLSWVGGSLVAAGFIAIVAAVISGKIVAAVLRVRIDDHARRLEAVEIWRTTAAGLLDVESRERLKYEIQAAREFAGRGELSRLIADNTEQYRALQEKIDALGEGLHGRVTESAKRIAAIEGRMRREDEG
jgi:uncharacterized protein HemX